MTFRAGQSGNPKGRAKGSRNSATIARERVRELLEKGSAALMKRALEMAKTEPSVMAALLDRIVPKLKPVERPVPLAINAADGAAANAHVVLRALADGALTLEEARQLADVLAKLHSTTLAAGTPGGFQIHINLQDDPKPSGVDSRHQLGVPPDIH